MKARTAVVGSGNIGTDLMFKLLRSDWLHMAAMVGIDANSEGLARARALGVEATSGGVDWLLDRAHKFDLVFDATSARAHTENASRYREADLCCIDLTPAKLGPGIVPVVNLDEYRGAFDVNMVTCGGQATIPMVAAVSSVCNVSYAEIVVTIASRSAGPGTRQSIDEFTQTTKLGLEQIGGAAHAKAIIILNPAEPPLRMRDTVVCAIPESADTAAIAISVREMCQRVADYVPGYRLRSEPIFDTGRVTIFIEVEGAGDYLPAYAGNLDIMTAAAIRVGEQLTCAR